MRPATIRPPPVSMYSRAVEPPALVLHWVLLRTEECRIQSGLKVPVTSSLQPSANT